MEQGPPVKVISKWKAPEQNNKQERGVSLGDFLLSHTCFSLSLLLSVCSEPQHPFTTHVSRKNQSFAIKSFCQKQKILRSADQKGSHD